MSNINDNELIDNELIEVVICDIKKHYTEAQKRAIYKWRANNKDKLKIWNDKNQEMIKLYSSRYVERNRDKLKDIWKINSKKTYDYKQECKRLCNISVF
jgi:hypothetical protein